MLTLFREGGVPMFAVLLFGLLALGVAARDAWRRRPPTRQLALWIAATVFAALSGVAADLAAVGHHVSDRYAEYRPQIMEVLLQGLAESMAPAILGFSLAALAAFVGGFGGAAKSDQP